MEFETKMGNVWDEYCGELAGGVVVTSMTGMGNVWDEYNTPGRG